jgi:hypothetical protein
MTEIDDTNRIRQILDSCRDDAAAQVAVVKEMLTNGDTSDVRSLAVMAMALENTANTVVKFYQLNLDGIEHGLA